MWLGITGVNPVYLSSLILHLPHIAWHIDWEGNSEMVLNSIWLKRQIEKKRYGMVRKKTVETNISQFYLCF